MKLRLLLLLAITSNAAILSAQTTSGTVGAFAQDPNPPAAESFNLKLTQKLELTSIIQTRYQLFDDTTKIDGFDLRRARLVFRGDAGPKFGYRLQLEMANTPKILDAVATYKPFDIINVNIGQSKTPYCYDNYYSPFTLMFINRSQLDNALSNRESDLYGNNQGRDIGIWLTGKYSVGPEEKKRPILEYVLGVYNGAGINVTDNNNFKDFGAALRISPVKDLWISGRAYHGLGAKLLADPDSTADRLRYGADLTYKYKRFLVEGEYLTGEDNGAGAGNELFRSGYTATIGYTAILDKLVFAARIDNYDKNTETELNAVNKYLIAGSWYFTKVTRLQLQYDIVSEEDADNQIDNNVFSLQFSAGF